MSTRIGTPTKRAKTNGLPAKRRFTVDEYYCMAKAGVLRPDERVELLDGEIFTMAAMHSPHASRIRILTQWCFSHLRDRALVSVQLPVRLDGGTELEPDLALLVPRADDYESAHPGPSDILLIIEISDTSLAYDRRKLARYAAAGIPDVWIFDLRGKRALVYREPEGSCYRQNETIRRGGVVSPLAFPDLVLSLDDIVR